MQPTCAKNVINDPAFPFRKVNIAHLCALLCMQYIKKVRNYLQLFHFHIDSLNYVQTKNQTAKKQYYFSFILRICLLADKSNYVHAYVQIQVDINYNYLYLLFRILKCKAYLCQSCSWKLLVDSMPICLLYIHNCIMIK